MKRLKHFIAAALALALCVACLTACGGGGNNDDPKANTTPAPDGFVYVADYTPISGDFTNGFSSVVQGKDCIYATTYQQVDNTPEGVTPEYEGQYYEYKPVIYKIGFDGSAELVNFKATEIPEGMQGSSNISSMHAAEDGTLYILEDIYAYSTEGMPDDIELYSDEYWEKYDQYFQSEEKYQIRVISPDGSDLATIDLKDIDSSNENVYFYNFAVDSEGNIYLPNDTVVFVMDKTGQLLFKLESENYIERVVGLTDGTVACSYYGSSGYQLSVIDTAAKSFGDEIPLPRNVGNVIPGGGDYDFYYTNGVNFYGYDAATQESKKVLNWISCDINSDEINDGNIIILDDGRIILISSEWNSDYTKADNEIVTLSQKPASSVPQKTIITLATQYLNWNVRSRIIEFNKSNDQYRIEVLDYSEYNTDDDYSAGLTKLTTEILAGNMPDILDLNGIPTAQLASKGYLEDLYPYLDSDASLSRDDIFPSILTALETNGKLYTTCDTFSIQTVIGASSVVGDKPGWTVDEFNAALASMPEGCTAFDQYMTRNDVLYQCMALDMDSFVDWSTGKCNFDSEAFVKMLQFVKSFPSSFDWDNYEWSEEDDESTRIASGKQMLLSTSISDFDYCQMYKAMFGGDITYIGFPTEYGTGNMLSIRSGYAMSSKCANKDGAWQFLRQFFTAEYQEQYSWQFPTNKKAFDKKLEAAMTPKWRTDENGNYVLDENGNKIEESQGGWGWGSISIDIYALTQEEADEILDLINTTTKVYKADDSITSIVTEQAEAYFSGQKSAEEVAKLVQSKANIYVNEQR